MMKNKSLWIIFVVLLGIYLLSEIFSGNRNKSFEADIIKVDTTAVTSIIIDPKGPQEEIHLLKEGENWIATQGNISVKAIPGSVSGILHQLANIRASRIVSKTEEKWKEYEVTDSLGIRVKVAINGKIKEDFVVGRFNFNQATRSGTSFIRLADGDEIYAVDGFLALAFGQEFSSFRDRSFLEFSPEDLTSVSEIDPATGNSFTLSKNPDGQWMNDEGAPVDSVAFNTYLGSASKLSGSTFADDFDTVTKDDKLVKKMVFKANNQPESITIEIYYDSLRNPPYVVHSSLNQDAYFSSDTTGIAGKLNWNFGESPGTTE